MPTTPTTAGRDLVAALLGEVDRARTSVEGPADAAGRALVEELLGQIEHARLVRVP